MVLPDGCRCCTKVLYGIAPSPSSRKISFHTEGRKSRLNEESEEFQNHQETPVSEKGRADTSAWSCTSCRQPRTHVRACKACTEAIKEDLEEGRAEVLGEASEAKQSIRYARRNFANRKTTMTTLWTLDGPSITSRRGMEMVIHDFDSDPFDSHVHLPPHHLRENRHVIPKVLPSDVRQANMSMKNRTSPGLYRDPQNTSKQGFEKG
ncbi:hypothetical protein RB195_005381 [Necator americanus]|uniref:RanBP2-type domain-containing protein n=1 Tax=Necator americanus TaxID=51031 RepID=A0ABR1BMH9_NECAM